MKSDKVIHHIVHWLSDYLLKSGCKGFVVGISGGIDSALTSTLCAMTGHTTYVLSLPIYQHQSHVNRALEHAAWLKSKFTNITHRDIELTPAFETLKKIFPTEVQDDLTMANTRSRLRMLSLYVFAGHYKLLVAGTGNKVEDFGVGFYTKYGDGGVDISPIADLYKTQVYTLARHLGISESILAAPPSDGLYNDEYSDEDQIGASYPELEWAMEFEKNPLDENSLTERQKKVLEIYRKRHFANKHKMEPIPVCKIPQEYLI
ncbi:MAG: NAD(+) synthase [Bacteroidia bacterium]|nr:NAD(+) synthase [Bacteroidia bacterium]